MDEPKCSTRMIKTKSYLLREWSMAINTWKWLKKIYPFDDLKINNLCRNQIYKKLTPPSLVMRSEYFGTLKNEITILPKKDHHVLIPRMDTFQWLKTIINYKGIILEIGSGTGAMAFQLEKQNPLSTIYSSETSKKAMNCAILNRRKQSSKINLLRQDFIFSPLEKAAEMIKKLEITAIISNPPYIRRLDYIGKVAPSVRRWEPKKALLGDGNDGLGYHRRILKLISLIPKGGNFDSFRGAIEFDGSIFQKNILKNEYSLLFDGTPEFRGNRCMVIR